MGVWLVPDEADREKLKPLREVGFEKGKVKDKVDLLPHVTLLSFDERLLTPAQMVTIIKAGRKKDATQNGTETISEGVDLRFTGIEARNHFYRSEMLMIDPTPKLRAILDYFCEVLDLDNANDCEEINNLKKELGKEKLEELYAMKQKGKIEGMKATRWAKCWPHISIMYLSAEDRENKPEEEKELEKKESVTDGRQKILNTKHTNITKVLKGAHKNMGPKMFSCKEIWVCSKQEQEQKYNDKGKEKVKKDECHRIQLRDIPGLKEFIDKFEYEYAGSKAKAKK